MSELKKKIKDSTALERKQSFHCKLPDRTANVSGLFKCRPLGEEGGDDNFLLYGSAKDCTDSEAVLEVEPKDEGLASQFDIVYCNQPSLLSLFSSAQKQTKINQRFFVNCC